MRKLPLVRTASVSVLFLALLCMLSAAGRAQAAPRSSHSPQDSPYTSKSWHIVPGANSQQTYNALNGVVALSATDVWAVGADSSYPNPNQPLIEHWNGSNWSIIPSPSIDGTLYGITPIPGTQEFWAVGTQFTSNNGPQPLIERWDGTQWNLVPSPILNADPENTSNILYAVTTLSANNAWAVGVYQKNSSLLQVALVEHWNGKKWSVITSGTPNANYSWLYGIAAFSAKDIWAVGTFTTTTGSGESVLTEHWNGTTWSIVAGSNPGSIANFLYGVTRIPGTNQLWAVGNTLASVGSAYQTLIERWDGTKWNLVTSPSPGLNGNGLQGVAALSANNAWAVGSDTSGNGDQTLIEHWNGTTWSVVSSPNPSNTSFLSAVTRVPHTGKLWGVGNYYDNNGNQLTLTELYS